MYLTFKSIFQILSQTRIVFRQNHANVTKDQLGAELSERAEKI